MKLVLSSAVLASVLAPAFSFSYLDSLSPNPVSYSRGGSPSNGSSYLDALNSPVSRAPSGGGMKSYLDTVATNPSSSGPGLGSYTDSMSAAAAPGAVAEPVAAAPAAPVVESSAPVVAASGASYLDTLSTGRNAISGPGLLSYLDTVPRNAPVRGGAGIESYTSALPVTNTVYGTGTGLNSYTDNLSGGSKPSKSFSPYGKGTPKAAFKPSFSGSAGGQDIGFTLEASDLSELVKAMSGGGTIRLSGSIDSVSFN
ncbi:hypothetical protein IV203_000809 [Nitzschia inconspicua]|uniref:Secreted protein n=1 Tax=Nitzschia inconspicua TaxID=303405 RepID=A0A9K3L5T9_9STRA|nr:hypothetical protein IV203_000809 [Nitzschia inconspicua]